MRIYMFFSWAITLLVSAGIGALYIFLLKHGYFPTFFTTLWIALVISVIMLAVNAFKTAFARREGLLPPIRRNGNWYGTIFGAIATIGNTMLALSARVDTQANSTIFLVYFSAMFFAFEMIQLASYTWHEIKCL